MQVESNDSRARDPAIMALKKKGGIGIYFSCRSLAGLQRLSELYSIGQLKLILEKIFSAQEKDNESVFIETLHWDVRNFINCMQCLCPLEDLEVFSKLYAMSTSSVECIVRSINIDEFPADIQELILMKSTGQLFVVFNIKTPLAAVYSMATMCGVSKLWWNALSYRQYNKRSMKRFFRQVCSPFKCYPRQLQSLDVGGEVVGLTEYNGKLYVVCLESSAVRVFLSRSPFSRLDDINVRGLNNPNDIVVCDDKSQLYIADVGGDSRRGIWRVNLLNNKQVDKFITIEWLPYSLSINSSRLLITPRDGDALFLYRGDGIILIQIQLPEYMQAIHAVETTQKTYIVCYQRRYTGSEDVDSVCEVDVDGRVVRTFYSHHMDIKFNEPYYLAKDGNNHVIVADNDRVVLLNSNLQLNRVLMPTLREQPWSLCLSKSNGLLFINLFKSSSIEIHEVLCS